MKKLTAVLLAGFMALSLTACSGNNADTDTKISAPESTSNITSAERGTNDDDIAADSSQTENDGQPSTEESSDTVKILVAYFSATNTTAGVAKNIADCLNADLYEITPEDPYTSADLDYHDDNSRSTVEMNDPDSRPAISGSVENMEQYDIVFIGYPIWWGEAPRILSTFAESYDFSGKTVVPFCTSGGSGVGSSAANLEKLTSGAAWLSGTRLNGSDSRSTVAEWINGLGLNITAE